MHQRKRKSMESISTYEPMREQDAFHMMHIPLTFRLQLKVYFYLTIFLCDATVDNYSKHVVMGASDNIKTVYRNIRTLMQLTQCCVFIRHFDDV